MDRLKLSRIDEGLESSEVAALCFLCSDVVNRKRLQGVDDAKKLFWRLEEKGLLENNNFLSLLLHTIRRADLLNLLETDSRPPGDPLLSDYRVMLYKIYEDLTQENFEKMKFLLSDKLGRRQTEACNTALDVFAEMEKIALLSNTNLQELHAVLKELDQQLASTVRCYMDAKIQQPQTRSSSHVSVDDQTVVNNNNGSLAAAVDVSMSELQPSGTESLCSDAQKTSSDHTDYYVLTHNPRGLCVVINNEDFHGPEPRTRRGTQADAKALHTVFSRLGFTVETLHNLTAGQMRLELKKLGTRNFWDDDALVVCVLSHGEKECVFGSDEKPVALRELTQPFTSRGAPSLAGKPKLFFIQACQGSDYQRGSLPCPPRDQEEEEGDRRIRLEEDAAPANGETVPWDADILLGMATVPDCKSFRHPLMGSIYIQELCTQLTRSAESSAEDDILTVLTRVNREVSRGQYLCYKQMPQPKYTLTKKLVLKFV